MKPVDILRTFIDFNPEELKVQNGRFEIVPKDESFYNSRAISALVRSALKDFEALPEFKKSDAQDLKDQVIEKLERLKLEQSPPMAGAGAALGSVLISDCFEEEVLVWREILDHPDSEIYLPKETFLQREFFRDFMRGLESPIKLIHVEPSTFVNRSKKVHYSGDQHSYIDQVKRVVSFSTAVIVELQKTGKNLEELFHVMLLFVAKIRSNIHLKGMGHHFIEKDNCLIPEKLEFGVFRFQYCGLLFENLVSGKKQRRGFDFRNLYTSVSGYSTEYNMKIEKMMESMREKDVVYSQKTKDNLFYYFSYGEQKSSQFKATIEIEGKLVDLSIVRELPHFEEGYKSGDFWIYHTIFSIEKTVELMSYIGKKFAKILKLSSNDPEFMVEMATFQYLMAHACPFMRGSAAVCEWFEMALFAAHGFLVRYKSDKYMNLEALTSSLAEFIESYVSEQFFDRSPLIE